MSLNQLHKQLKEKSIKYLFTDYYDTLVHRTEHPNYTLRIWAKLMIRELGLPISIDALYFTRQEAVSYLEETLQRADVEIPYEVLQEEIYKRLLTTHNIPLSSKSDFLSLFEDIDVRAEQTVQYINQDVLDTLEYFKTKGLKIILVSDFYGSKSLFKKLLLHHGLLELFDGIYSSASLEKSKHSGSIYKPILSDLEVEEPQEVMMIGDNERSDVINAKKIGLNAFLLPHKKHLNTNKRNNFGNDKKRLRKSINALYKSCNRAPALPFTEYIVFYHVFVERLYETCKKQGVKNLFFLSREGQYLKRLFDSYQHHSLIQNDRVIQTHYLKISRQASLQLALRPIHEESFGYLQRNYKDLSINDFLTTLTCSESLIKEIADELHIKVDVVINDFFNSIALKKLKKNVKFLKFYNHHRDENKKAFEAYISSFKTNIETDGIFLVDIGWGGTMQESIYKFFKTKIPVTGYYLGLGELYNIQPKTQRSGLIFSVLPYKDYYDKILMANMQLYEQFSAANHGSALAYSLEADGYVLEAHKPEEKWLYDNHLKVHQEVMFALHLKLLKELEPLCYDYHTMQQSISNLALKMGLFQSIKKLRFLNTLSQGFYQNIGTNQVGLTYKPPQINKPFKSLIRFLLTPERYFRYLVKLKLALFNKNKILAFITPMFLVYIYYRCNKFIRFKILNRYLLLKYNFFK